MSGHIFISLDYAKSRGFKSTRSFIRFLRKINVHMTKIGNKLFCIPDDIDTAINHMNVQVVKAKPVENSASAAVREFINKQKAGIR